MKLHYDKKKDALYIRFIEDSYKESEEIKEDFILDYGDKGQIIGLEILEVSKHISNRFLQQILKKKVSLNLVLDI